MFDREGRNRHAHRTDPGAISSAVACVALHVPDATARGSGAGHVGRVFWLQCVIAFALAFPISAAGEFCSDLKAKYGAGIMRCVDFADAMSAGVNWVNPQGRAVTGTHRFNPTTTATPGSTGSLHWKIRSYTQVKAEEPGLTNGQAWRKALESNTDNWQKWIGVDRLVTGQEYWFQFKQRFNSAYKTRWGGGGMKVWGMDVGCRTFNGVSIPPLCEQRTDPNTRVTDLATAMASEITMTTANWPFAGTPNAERLAMPSAYQGSTQFTGSIGFTPIVQNTAYGSSQILQPGPDSSDWTWVTNPNYERGGAFATSSICDSLGLFHNPQLPVTTGQCVTYGQSDVWHEWTILIKPGPTRWDTNPLSGSTPKHDSTFKVWYDGMLIVNFDPAEGTTFKPVNQKTAAQCAAQAGIHPAYDDCRTGMDITTDSRGKDIAHGGQESWCQYSCDAADPGADMTQFLIWTFSYRRGRPPSGSTWCNDNITDPADASLKSLCNSLASSGDEAADFNAFLTHSEVNVYFDDWVVSKVPLPMKLRPAGGRLVGQAPQTPVAGPPLNFGLDARDLVALPPNTVTRLYMGPTKTFYNTRFGPTPPDDIYNASGQQNDATFPTFGASILTSTNHVIEYPVTIAVPLGGGFILPQFAAGRGFYFGGGHSGLRHNRVNTYNTRTGRWSQSTYTPDMSSVIGGALGPRYPTPPGIGCQTRPYIWKGNISGATTWFETTGDTTAGSAVITNVASIRQVCPILGQCPPDMANTGGYVLDAPGVPLAAVVKSVSCNGATCTPAMIPPYTITLTHPATITATGVALKGGPATCETGGTPNGSSGGRGWWEHMGDRATWDARVGAWMLVQNGGTWLYYDTTETWKQITGPWPLGASMMCGPGDYTIMGVKHARSLNKTLLWCSQDIIYAFNYGSGPPNFTGATWEPIHTLAAANRNPQTDVGSASAWDDVHGIFYHFSVQTQSGYTGRIDNNAAIPQTGLRDPILAWYKPNATGTVGGTSGKMDSSKPNFPQGQIQPRDPTNPITTHPCYSTPCQDITASLAVDGQGSLYILGRRAGDGQIALWKLTDPLGPNEAWTYIDDFKFNTTEVGGLRLRTDAFGPLATDGDFAPRRVHLRDDPLYPRGRFVPAGVPLGIEHGRSEHARYRAGQPQRVRSQWCGR